MMKALLVRILQTLVAIPMLFIVLVWGGGIFLVISGKESLSDVNDALDDAYGEFVENVFSPLK